VTTSLAGDEPITATIDLIGLPAEEMMDAASNIVVTSGLENVALGSHVLLKGEGEGVRQDTIGGYVWTLSVPVGSDAVLNDPTSRTPAFIPDATGTYTVELAIINQQGVPGAAASITVHAATWVGVGITEGAAAGPPQCIACHSERVETWVNTPHASFLERALDGKVSEHYSSQCVSCHAVGYDNAAANDGFDDVAKEVGWVCPDALVEGNWAELMTNFPRLANLANVQCENCHGPGGEHSGKREAIAVSLRSDVCVICHDPLRQGRAAQWTASAHDDVGFVVPNSDPISDGRCGRCHSAQGFIDYLDGNAVSDGGLHQVTCPVCHDPHDATHEGQLRAFDTMVLPDGRQVRDMGPSALCLMCHNGGVGPEQVHRDEPVLPHGSTAAEMMVGTGGYDYGQIIKDSAHSAVIPGCVSCHMATTPGMNDQGTPDDIGDDVPLPGHNRIGEHTFRMTWNGGTPADLADDVENIATCTDCHEELASFNRKAAGDYDGNGESEGIQDEVWGLLGLVHAELLTQGVQWQGEHPLWSTVTTEAQKRAIYNLRFVAADGSLGVHNAGRAVRLLQLSYLHLTGHDVPGATRR
jgi:hypothetical protein